MSTAPVAANTPQPRPGATARSGVWRWLGPAVITLAIIAVAGFGLFLATVTLGQVYGNEFCPQTFERRAFHFMEIPWVGIQVTGIRRDIDTELVELHIIQQKYITVIQSEPKTWHLVDLLRTSGKLTTGDAKLLITYLDAQDEKKEPAWLNWSEAHPELAKVFWPVVAKAAREGNYLVMPDLFAQTRSATSAKELQNNLDAVLASQAKNPPSG